MHQYRPPKRYYPHQVGWITPPMAMSRAVNDFVRLSPDSVGVNHRVLHAPGFTYSIEDRRKHFGLLEESVACLAECGVDDIAQVGCNFVHSAGHSLADIMAYQARIEAEYGVSLHMEGTCFIDAMAALGAQRIAVFAGYNDRAWVDGYLRFLADSPLTVVHAANLVEQGFFATEAAMRDEGWIFDSAILPEAVAQLLDATPHADAVVMMGMPCWTTPTGDVANVMSYVDDLEARFGVPIIDGEIALFWSVYKSIAVAPRTRAGILLGQL